MLQINGDHLYQNDERVQFIESPHASSGFTPEGIILHDTAGRIGPATATLNWFANPAAKASAHFTVDRQGGIGQSVMLNKAAWHAGRSKYKGRSGCNNFTFGIEMVNPGKMARVPASPGAGKAWFGEIFYTGGEHITRQDIKHVSTPEHGDAMWMDYPSIQVEAVVNLCRVLVETYKLKFITTHWFVSPGRKVDPNPLFPLEQVRSQVFGRGDKTEPPQFGDGECIVNAGVRRWPSRESALETTIKDGTRVDVVRSGYYESPGVGREQWHLCRMPDGRSGWIYAALIDLD